jgi:hypothetical protein
MASFLEHGRGCAGCAGLLEEARRGQQWLKLLAASTPPAPGDLLPRILARTQGVPPLVPAGLVDVPLATKSRWSLPFLPQYAAGMVGGRGIRDARLLMTATMAVFSVALTLSVAGVRLTSVHAAELRPQAVEANVSRSFYGTKKQVVSFYDNLRLVYEVESKMRELRGDAETVEPTSQTPEAMKPAAPSPAAPDPNGPGKAGSRGAAPAAKAPGTGKPAPTAAAPQGQAGGGLRAPQIWHGTAVPVSFPAVANPGLWWQTASAAPAARAATSLCKLSGAMSKERNRI